MGKGVEKFLQWNADRYVIGRGVGVLDSQTLDHISK